MSSFNLSTADHQLYGYAWPVDQPQAVVALVHGHGEHIHRYDHLGETLNQHEIALVGYDLIGHGRSIGKRGHFPSFEKVLDSIADLITHVHGLFPETPIILMGHSMGGNLVANFVLRRKPTLDGVILSSPWLRLAFAPSSLDKLLAKAMLNIWPSFTQSSKLDALAISREIDEVGKYQLDPLIHDQVSPQLFTDVVNGGEYALANAEKWHLPLLLYHGSSDRITSCEASQEFAQKAGGGDVTWRVWEGGYHELINDTDKEAVKRALVDWVLSRGKQK